jgi:hypothetical protein
MPKIVYLVNDVTSACDCDKHSLSRFIEDKREDLRVQPCLQIAPLSSCDRINLNKLKLSVICSTI